ncbi:MAG TPA: cytochrome C oxidase subunit IV family protein [Dissulfurispiraceae bacterium]|nr:cytochrome C oxidase subunit IV family protein [Dissulfurispiraceae bacterium]
MDRGNVETQIHAATYRTYVYVWIALLVFLGITIAVAKLSLLAQYSVIGSLLIASLKAGLVLVFFMHLKNEGWIVKGMLALAVGALTFIIVLTFSDVWFR